MNDLCRKSAVELAGLISRREASPVEVLEVYLEMIKKLNPRLNAVVTLEEEKALDAAREAEKELAGEGNGPLHGVPVAIKDNVYTAGIRTTCGSMMMENYVPEQDAVLVERLKKAGAIVLGKTNLPEFGLIPVTDNLLFGPTRNPWNLEKTSGGSSGGSAAGIACGMFPLASGNDGGGSIRIPASLCGIYGIKPSFGRVPIHPRFPGWETMNHEGPLTRTVEDAALMLQVMAGAHRGDRMSLPQGDHNYLDALKRGVKGLRMAFSPDLGYAVVDPEVKKITARAAGAFEELGCEVEEIDPGLFSMEEDLQVMIISETMAKMEEDMDEWKEKAYPPYQVFMQMADSISGKDLARVQMRREELWSKARLIWEKYDLLLTPSTAVPAFTSGEGGPIGPETINGQPVGPVSWIAFTFPFNFTGQPAASIPCGFTEEGLPVGLQVIGDRFDEHTVLAASAAFEKIRPWSDHWPQL